MTTTNRRWICPTCGAGVNAPSRPRRDDVRRYCLDCSAATGRLVERICPALERERAARKTKSAARTTRARERDRSTEIEQRSAGDVDLLAEARRFARLPVFAKMGTFPTFTFRHSTMKSHTSGRCFYGWDDSRIVVTVGIDPHDAPGVVIHEMVHALFGPGEGHSAHFWSVVRRAAREAWPDATFDFANARDGWTTQLAIREGLAKRAGAAPIIRTRVREVKPAVGDGLDSLRALLP